MRWSPYLTAFLLGALCLLLMGAGRCDPPAQTPLSTLLRVYNVHADVLGSVGLITSTPGPVTDANGVFERTTYTPYGDISTAVGNRAEGFPEYSYTGQEYDPESGLHYFRARYYDATLGRFLSPDPALNAGGVSFNRLASAPQALNAYSYVQNNPANRVDPSGLFDLQVDLGFGAPGLGFSGDNLRFGGSLGVNGAQQPGTVSAERVDPAILESARRNISDWAQSTGDPLLIPGTPSGDAIANATFARLPDPHRRGFSDSTTGAITLNESLALELASADPRSGFVTVAHEAYHTYMRSLGVPISLAEELGGQIFGMTRVYGHNEVSIMQAIDWFWIKEDWYVDYHSHGGYDPGPSPIDSRAYTDSPLPARFRYRGLGHEADR